MKSLLVLSFVGLSHAWQPADLNSLTNALNSCLSSSPRDGSQCYACDNGDIVSTSTASCTDGSTPQFISDWDTSQVTSFQRLFRNRFDFNTPIGNWDTSKVTSMYEVFVDARKFNQPLNDWDTSSVKYLTGMFKGASAFNQPLHSWNVSTVEYFPNMFLDSAFNQDISTWDVSNGLSMSSMFKNTPFNQDIGNWDVRKVTNFWSIFENTPFNQDISKWKPEKVVYFTAMFKDNTKFNHDLSCWSESMQAALSVDRNLDNMFNGATAFDKALCWKNYYTLTRAVITATDMFLGSQGSALDCDNSMCKSEGDTCTHNYECDSYACDGTCLPSTIGLDCSQCNDGELCKDNKCVARFQPKDSSHLAGVISLCMTTDECKVCMRGELASECPAFGQATDISDWDISLLTALQMSNFQKGYDLSKWDTSRITSFKFRNSNFTGLQNWNTSSVTNMRQAFYEAQINDDISKWDTSKVTDMKTMFYKSSFNRDISAWDTSSVTNMHAMFGGQSNQKNPFNHDISCWDISKVTTFQRMFEHSDFSHRLCWNTGSATVTDMFKYSGGSKTSSCSASGCPNDACSTTSDCTSFLVCDNNVCSPPPNICRQNQHASGGACVACPAGKTNAAGDSVSSDTACDPTLCQENHHVVNHACQPCALGTRPAGDDASGDDTQCEVGPCGGYTCVRGTCVNDVCDCPVGYGGMTCSKDMTASGQLQFLESRRRSIPSKQDIKNIQKDIKSFIKDTLKKALLTKSVKEAVKETKMAIEERDLSDRAKLAVIQLNKQPVIALSTENKDTQDDCLQSDCAHVDIKDKPDELIFLNTQEEAGSWSVLSSGGNLLSKQTRVSENVYDMQCWNNSWTDKVQFDISEGSDFFECNDHIILIGSQAAVCTDETCQNGGTCAQDGLSFVCDCPIGFGGEFCEDEVSVGNCYDLDCSDFGGHKTELCTECTEANCCNYATRDLFNAHCDTLTSTADYVNAKCCHRNYCI